MELYLNGKISFFIKNYYLYLYYLQKIIDFKHYDSGYSKNYYVSNSTKIVCYYTRERQIYELVDHSINGSKY